MKTVEQKADELVDKFIQAQDNTVFETSEENHEKCQSLNEELGIDIEDYWQRLAIQCAIISVDEILNIVHTLKSEQYWMAVKQELEKRLK